MNITVTTHAQASPDPVHAITGASRWDVDEKGCLNIWSSSPDGIIATFAPGWLSVSDDDHGATAS